MRWIPLLLIIVVLSLGLLVVNHRFRDSNHYLIIILMFLYFVGLGVILFTPISFDGTSVYITSPGIGNVNKLRLYLHGLGFFENIILTIPLGIIIKRFVSQLPLVILGVVGIIISTGIEVTQYYLSHQFLINRSTDINDIIANTLGIIIGGLLMILYNYRKKLVE